MKQTNPVKIVILGASALLALALAWGRLYRPPLADPGQALDGVAASAVFALVAFHAWWVVKNNRSEPRRRWGPWQVALLTVLSGLAVQLTGGLASFLTGFYLLLCWLAVFRADGGWRAVPPVAAAAIELGSAYWGDRLYPEAVPAVSLVAMLALGYAAARLFAKRSFAAAAAAAPTEPERPGEVSFSGEVSLKHDLAALCALAQASVGSRTCAVFQLETLGSSLRMLACKSYSPHVAAGAAIDVARGFLGWVVRERQGLLYPSFDKDFRALGYYEKQETVGSVLAVPVLVGDAVRGMLVADSERPGAFDESAKLLLAGFGDEAGRLIDLHQRHSALGLEKERLEVWNKRLELLASRLTVSDVVGVMKELVPALVDCDHLALLALDGDAAATATVLLSDPPAVGYPVAGATVDIAGSLAQQAARTREWRAIDDFYRRAVTVPRYSRAEKLDHGFRSVLAGPLLYEDRCHYVLVLESRRSRAFDSD
ncbi:MAG: GAF domain-containing protein, partial [Candidatus Edwardsbacteria bacterium]|nr:GAF domain-containing protein [Candidatus Edwardsbacteria bacterium]